MRKVQVSFVLKQGSLPYSKTMLLISNNQAQFLKFYIFLY